jgi:hypothetical protein
VLLPQHLFSNLSFEHKTKKPIGATSNTASKQANIIMKLNICFLALTLVVSLGHAAGVYTDEEVRSGNKASTRDLSTSSSAHT